MAEFLAIIGILSNFATVTEISYGVINKFILEIQAWRKRHKSWDDMMSKFTEYLHYLLRLSKSIDKAKAQNETGFDDYSRHWESIVIRCREFCECLKRFYTLDNEKTRGFRVLIEAFFLHSRLRTRADKILVELGTANIQILEYMQLLSLELHIQDREDSKIIKASLGAMEKSRRPLASVVEGVPDSTDNSRSTKEQSREASLGRTSSLISQISTKLGVSDSLDDSCSTKEQSIKSASGVGSGLIAWIGTKRPKMRAGKKIGSGKRVDHIQEETVTAGSPVMVSNQREEDLGVSSQNTIEVESSGAINDTGSIPTASTNRTYTTNEPIDKLVDMDTSFHIRVDKSFSCNPGDLILCHMDPQTSSPTIHELIPACLLESSMPEDESSGDKDVPRVDEPLVLSHILVAEGVIAPLQHPSPQNETQPAAQDIPSSTSSQDHPDNSGPKSAHPPAFSAVDLKDELPNLASNILYRNPCGCLQDQAEEALITTLGIQAPRIQSPSAEKSGDAPELFWKGTSFASLRFGHSSTMIFFQNSNGWIQCGLIPHSTDDDEDEKKEDQEDQEDQEDEDYEECLQEKEHKGLILLEPVALATLGSPLGADFLEPKTIGLFYVAEKHGTQMICDHRLEFYGERPFLWSLGKLETLKIPVAPSTRIFLFGIKPEKYICFEEAGGNLVYLQHDLSKGEWVQISGPQPPSGLLHHCPLGIHIEKESVQNGSGVETVNFIHHFYHQYPSTESEDEYIMTQIVIPKWQEENSNTSTRSHKYPIGLGDQLEFPPQRGERTDEPSPFFRSTPNIVYVEQFLPANISETEITNAFPPQIVCRKHEGSRFHVSDSLFGIIYVSELGKMALIDMEQFIFSEDGRYITQPSKLLFGGGFSKGTISDVKLWLRMGWTLERSVGSVGSEDGSDEDSSDEDSSDEDSSDEYGSDEDGRDSEESSIVAQREIKARRGPRLLQYVGSGSSN